MIKLPVFLRKFISSSHDSPTSHDRPTSLPEHVESTPTRITAEDHQKLALLLSLVNDKMQPNINALTVAVRNLDALALNVKALGYDLAKQLASALPAAPSSGARIVGLGCKMSVQADFETDWLSHWCSELRIPVIFHRKLWELAYLLQALYDNGALEQGRRGLGFGCGVEPLGSYFAANGISAVLTDLPPDDSRSAEWAMNNEYAQTLDHARDAKIVSREDFERYVSHRYVDMNYIPDDLIDFDFCWSVCALEHLGSIQQGLDFMERSVDCLRPGGVAVHTMEYNVNPDGPTVDNWLTVFFQRKHIEELADRLRKKGHSLAALDFDPGSKPLDRFIDLPPWHDGTMSKLSQDLGQPCHLKVAADGFVVTCFGVIIRKGVEGE